MSKRIPTVTRELIESAVLPTQTKTYTVIPHSDVISVTEQLLAAQGFEVVNERYKCTKSAQVAQGIYYLNYGSDPDMKMMFAWSNSYDKSMRFRCGIGGSLVNGATILSGANLGSWSRRHSGTALQETTDTIKDQITHAGEYYLKLVQDKEFMQGIELDFSTQSAMAGRLFIEQDLVNTEQISEMKVWIRQQNQSRNTLWDLYSYLVTTLQKTHPAQWMDAQIAAHLWVCKEFNIPITPVVIPVIPENFVGGHSSDGQPFNLQPIPEEIPGHQVTLEESIAEIVKETGEPMVIDVSHIPHVSQEEAIRIAEATQKVVTTSDYMIKVETLTPDQVQEKHFGKSKPAAEELVAQIMQQSSEAAEEFSQNAEPEFEEAPKEEPKEELGNHLFTVDDAEDTVCKLCGRDIMDPIHDEF